MSGNPSALKQMQWATARIVFQLYIVFSLATVVGGFLTAPLMSYYFFGSWRFWKYWDLAGQLFIHGWKMAGLVLKGEYGGFMFDVPLTSPPHSSPLPSLVQLSSKWEHGTSCGTCSKCCEKIGCPILEAPTGLCRGYDSFFWRYFNCGRFPSAQREIDYYGCPKWLMRNRAIPESAAASTALPVTPSVAQGE